MLRRQRRFPRGKSPLFGRFFQSLTMSSNWEKYAVNSDNLPVMDSAFGASKGYDPVNELMRALILRAIEDLNKPGELRDEAVQYLESEEDEYIFSFIAICRHLGFDPAKTKYAIMNADHRISTRRRAA